jgi:hypothetical protein
VRIAEYIDGGDAHFAVDRDVADQMYASVPGGIDAFHAVARAGQEFVERVVDFVTVDEGTRQFLVAGSKLAGQPNVHELAQAVASESRVVYILLDPVTLAHAHELRSRTAEGATSYTHAKLRDTGKILRHAATTLDLTQPVAVILPANLPFVRSDETAYRIVAELMGGLAPGSHLALTHHASDLYVDEHAEMFRLMSRLAAEGKTWGVTPRSHAEVAKFFDGLDLVDPGVVPMDEWRVSDPHHAAVVAAMYGAVGRK